MKRVIPFFAVFFLCVPRGWSQSSAQITTLRQAASLTNSQAIQHPPVSFEATVTYYRSYENNLFVQQDGAAIYLHPKVIYNLVPGDRVWVRGTMRESFRPFVENPQITLLRHGSLPVPIRPGFQQMIRAQTDGALVTVHALVQAADLSPNSQAPVSTTHLRLLLDGGHADASIDSDDPSRLSDLLDAEVEITGVQSGVFDNKMQLTGILFHVQSMSDVRILKRAAVDPWSIPVTPMNSVLAGYLVHDASERERVHGVITYYQPGVALVLEDGSKSIWITTDSSNPLQVGEVADAIGFPAVENGFLTLTRGEVRETATQTPISPTLFTWRQLAQGGNAGHSHAFDLVSVEGQVVTEVRQATQDEYVLNSDGHLLSAIFRHPGTASTIPVSPMYAIPIGTRIRITGICLMADANPFNGDVPFNILMRDVDDIVIIARPPWLNVRHLMLIVGLLLCVVIAIGIRSWALERRVRQKTAALAYLEQRRSRILEDINNSRPLSETLERITEVVSFRLHGAACWCEIADGASLGKRPPKITSQRIVQQEIPGRSGAALGSVFAAVHRLAKPSAEETSALALGASLATLAIETSHLYSDLVHRSEFDLLTDVPNRFSLEKHLSAMITEARRSANIFGFIFIDLDRFKLVNDRYGHQVGDAYLQEAASRMKHQLRPGDTLARLGGDEFAVVVSAVHLRSDVLEIAHRLEHCFDHPFSIANHIISGSASIGVALYPEDADTADTLLRFADAAMYLVKQSHSSEKTLAADVSPSATISKMCA